MFQTESDLIIEAIDDIGLEKLPASLVHIINSGLR
jgi:hypothetical protein